MAVYSIFFRPADTGLTPTFIKLVDQATSFDYLYLAPAISEVTSPAGSFGEYRFSITTGTALSFTIDGGAGLPAELRYIRGVLDPSDDVLVPIKADTQRIKLHLEARRKIHTTGPNANRMVFYDTNGTTILQREDLKDSTGAPTTTSIFEWVPVDPIP